MMPTIRNFALTVAMIVASVAFGAAIVRDHAPAFAQTQSRGEHGAVTVADATETEVLTFRPTTSRSTMGVQFTTQSSVAGVVKVYVPTPFPTVEWVVHTQTIDETEPSQTFYFDTKWPVMRLEFTGDGSAGTLRAWALDR